jgi:N-acetylglucosamine kinase-like BadF-type ATPase
LLYLGVDGGGSKTAFLLIDEHGNIRGQSLKGTIDFFRVGEEKIHNILQEGICDCCLQAQADMTDISFSLFGWPGYGDEVIKEIPIIEGIIQEVIGSERFKCVNDVEVGWAGSLACKPGIHLVAGTGAIGFAMDQSGQVARTSGWGHFCGDEGSAYWLGKKLLSIFTKQSDGREEKTPLYHMVKQHFKMETGYDLLSLLTNSLEVQREPIAKLALLLYEAANEGDQKAIEIYKEGAFELSLIINTLLRTLNFKSDEKAFVSYSGGVFNAGSFILDPLKAFIANKHVRLVKPILQPVVGAALYALHIDQPARDISHLASILRKQES